MVSVMSYFKRDDVRAYGRGEAAAVGLVLYPGAGIQRVNTPVLAEAP
jgi:hypothetical protein